MSGMDRNTGRALDGWAHVAQSIGVILTTAQLSRVMRRQVGSGLPRRVDSPISPVTLIDFYSDVATALANYEPRFRAKRMKLDSAPTEGKIALFVDGTYYPRGALGDFTVSVPASGTVSI